MAPQLVRVRSTAEQAQALSLAKINQAMFGAAEAGDLAKVEDMLAQGAQPDEFKSDRGFTALTAVCANGDDGHADTDGRDHWQVAERLINAGAQLELKTMVVLPQPPALSCMPALPTPRLESSQLPSLRVHMVPVLARACLNSRLPGAKELTFHAMFRQTSQTSVFPLIGIGGTPLIYAADVGNVKTVDVLIKAGARVDEQSASLNTALICGILRCLCFVVLPVR